MNDTRITLSNQIEGRLLLLAGVFLGLYATGLSLAPAVRGGSLTSNLSWSHWIGWLAWTLTFLVVHAQARRWLPGRDPYLLPAAALLSGWGMLTIWRLFPNFGLRQSLWLLGAGVVLVAGLRLPANLAFLRRYKYIWLTAGLLLTALTLLLGTNPLGYGPRMWLGCCGIYLQPSEPLKLLLIIYLSAYLADRFLLPAARGERTPSGGNTLSPRELSPAALLPLLAPTLIMTGLALALLVMQRDLGTASVFIFLYTVIVYISSSRARILAVGLVILAGAALGGSLLFDVVRVRVDAWLNPWLDPSGSSYQIVQSLIAIASGGLIGRGPGLGSPTLVPVSHSDFIFAAISEENGLVGAIGLLGLIGLLAERGLRAALNAPDYFRRYLAAGLTAFLAGQSILIIGGNLRLLPLTGVTLPFVSYGGSSLITSVLSLLFLLRISQPGEARPASLPNPRPYLQLSGLLFAGIGACALAAGWWSVFRAPALGARTDNARRSLADQFVKRGALLDRANQVLSASEGQPGSYQRRILYPDLSPIIGYTNPKYGQAGIEASMDATLRGLQHIPDLTLWWNHLLYGLPPPGLDVRLSLDEELQRIADQELGEHHGALVLLNARTGEILAMASHPTYDANRLEQEWEGLVSHPDSPLLNRATLGLYPPGGVLGPFLLAQAAAQGELPAPPVETGLTQGALRLSCTGPGGLTWTSEVQRGCPATAAALGKLLGEQGLLALLNNLGLYQTPQLRLPAASSSAPQSLPDPGEWALGQDLQLSPLQMALAAAALSTDGQMPAPRLVSAVDTPQAGWMLLPALGNPQLALPAGSALSVARALNVAEAALWQALAVAPNGQSGQGERSVTWFIGGTSPDWEGIPLALSLVIEENDPALAQRIGQTVLLAGIQP